MAAEGAAAETAGTAAAACRSNRLSEEFVGAGEQGPALRFELDAGGRLAEQRGGPLAVAEPGGQVGLGGDGQRVPVERGRQDALRHYRDRLRTEPRAATEGTEYPFGPANGQADHRTGKYRPAPIDVADLLADLAELVDSADSGDIVGQTDVIQALQSAVSALQTAQYGTISG